MGTDRQSFFGIKVIREHFFCIFLEVNQLIKQHERRKQQPRG